MTVPDSIRKVVVTQRIDFIESRREFRDAVDQKLLQWLIRADVLPIPLPNALAVVHSEETPQLSKQPILKNWLELLQPDAFLLSGGNDIGEYPERDATEHYLLSWAHTKKLPVLGICRGLQIMNVWAGGKLVQIEDHVRTRHKLNTADSDSDWPSEVNSFHQWKLDGCPPDFEVHAYTDDGAIEAIRHKHLPWEGWMWHPERETPFNDLDTKRIKSLFLEAP